MGWAEALGSLSATAERQSQSFHQELKTGCFQTIYIKKNFIQFSTQDLSHNKVKRDRNRDVKSFLTETCSLAALNMGSWMSVYILLKAL